MPCEQILNNTFTFEMYVEENNIDIDDLDDEEFYYFHYSRWYQQTPEGIQNRLNDEEQVNSDIDDDDNNFDDTDIELPPITIRPTRNISVDEYNNEDSDDE